MLSLPRLTGFRSSPVSLIMPVTRSRLKTTAMGADQQPTQKPLKSGQGRKVTPDEVVEPVAEDQPPPKKVRRGKQPAPTANAQPMGTAGVPLDPGPPPALVPAELSFSFEEAKQHLVTADTRFQDVFATAVCTPYQKLDRVEPFR